MNVTKNIKDSSASLKIGFLSAIIIISCFFSNQSLSYPYYSNFPKITVYILLCTLTFVIFSTKKSKYLDLISIILFVRIVLYIIPLLYIDNVEGYWGNYFAVVVSFFAYLISSQNHNRDISKVINKSITIFLTIISLQIIHLFFILRAKYGILSINLLKFYMVTPIGASNYIACVILPLLMYTYYSDITKKTKLSIIVISLSALLIIQSKNAIFVLVIFMSIKLIVAYMRSIRKIRDSSGIKNTILIITIIMIIMLITIIYFTLRYFIIKWNMGMNYDNTSLYETINALTSNRLNVYVIEIKRWTEHIFLGNGLTYVLGQLRSHNWLIDLLVQSGIIGFAIFIIALIYWYKKISRYLNKSNLIKSAFYLCIIILLQGLAEVSIFTISIDVLFWFMVGISISEVNYIKMNEVTEN